MLLETQVIGKSFWRNICYKGEEREMEKVPFFYHYSKHLMHRKQSKSCGKTWSSFLIIWIEI